MEKKTFDFEAFKKVAATRIKNGEPLLGHEGVFTPLIKEFLEEALEGEFITLPEFQTTWLVNNFY
jgi:putative transposase